MDWFDLLISVRSDGVYRAGFASSQEAYEKAVHEIFHGLDRVEKILSNAEYLVGGQLTEADVRLWVTLVRHPTLLFHRVFRFPKGTVYSIRIVWY